MTEAKSSSSARRMLVGALVLLALAVAAWLYFESRGGWPRGAALSAALRPWIEQQTGEQSLVARTILENYLETRANASRWSGVFWGFTFGAALFSALAGLILKFETIVRNEGVKKDLAAALSVAAALLVTISSSGDFQRKWQANRIAAAELERMGYDFLEKDGANARAYLASVGETLLRRHMAIVGSSEKPSQAAKGVPSKE